MQAQAPQSTEMTFRGCDGRSTQLERLSVTKLRLPNLSQMARPPSFLNGKY